MPLILVTGLPSSGKSRIAQELCDYFKKRLAESGDSRHVKLVSDSDNLDWDGRDPIYHSISKEKELRGWLKAETVRYLNLNQIVILDAAAYIKGFRYELYCASKEAQTQYCVVELLPPNDTCWTWNIAREDFETKSEANSSQPYYSRQIFDALLMRYEKCDPNNRWDSPLFVSETSEIEPHLDDIYNSIMHKPALSSNKCTSLSSTTTSIHKLARSDARSPDT